MYKVLAISLMLLSLFTGCSAYNSDDDLSAVPYTNNPNFIVDSQRSSALPGAFSM